MAFHVPESRRIDGWPLGAKADPSIGNNGAFAMPSPEPGWNLMLIASDGTDDIPEADGWEHVSVSARRGTQSRTPSWREMAFVKDAFWDGEDVVFQLHPRRSQYVNCHPHVLHLWRSRLTPCPEPPSILVGPS